MFDCFMYSSCNHIDCDKFCMRKYKLEYLYKQSLLPESKWKRMPLLVDQDGTDYDKFSQLAQIENDIVSFVQEGKNLYIHSHICGNSKTSWSIRLLTSYLNKIWPTTDLSCRALFISVPRFLLALKDNISVKSDYVDHIKQNIFII